MITIIVDNRDEYDDVMNFADLYVCRRVPSSKCDLYYDCMKCYEENHLRAGIRIIPPVDRDSTNRI